MFRLSFFPLMESRLFVVVVMFALLGALVLFFRRLSRLTKRQKRILFAIRFFLIILLALIMLRPSIVYTTMQKLPATLIFLVDQSESMSIADELGDQSRFDLLKKTFLDSSSLMKRLREEFEVELLAFDAHQSPLSFSTDAKGIEFPEKPEGTETAIGAALYAVLQRTGGKRVVGVVLMSDGTQRALPPHDQLPQDGALRLRESLLPVYSVRFGKTGNQARYRDIAVCDLFCNDQVFINNELIVSGQIRVQGYGGQKIPVILRFEGEDAKLHEVARIDVTPQSDDVTMFPYRFAYIPTKPGQWKLQVAVPPQQKELVETNNELGSFVRVVDGGIKILYLEGVRRFEQKYIRLSLDSSADIHVDYWRPSPARTKDANDRTQAERIAMTTDFRKSLLSSFFKPGEYAAYILGDLDATAFKPEELNALVERVNEGAGLIILAGQRSLGAGGYAQTKLADAIPVRMSTTDRVPIKMDPGTFDKDLPLDRKLSVPGPFVILPESDQLHFLTRLSVDPKKNREIWRELPPLEYVYRTGELKSGARICAVAKRKQSAKSPEIPFLITQLYGAGRVVVLTADGTWQWWMHGYESEHKKFWRQLVLWTAKMDEIPKGELAIELDRVRFSREESVDFRMIYRPADDESPKLSDFRAEVIKPDGSSEPITLTDDSGTPVGTFRDTDMPGDYRIKVSLMGQESSKELKKAQARFLVLMRNPELDNPSATPATLVNVSSITAARSIGPEEFPELLNELLKKRNDLMDKRETKKSLYDTWFVFALFVTALTMDWFLRKRWGLV